VYKQYTVNARRKQGKAEVKSSLIF